MKVSLAAVAGLVLMGAVSASAQDALMNSAETINRRNFKFAGYPIFTLGDGESDTGVGLRAGYGFGRRFDAEAKLSFFDGLTYYGLDGEWWIKQEPDISFALGVHRTSFDGGFEVPGLDTSLLVSDHIGDRLELYGGLRVAWEFPEEGDSYRRMHLVPGIEYKISDDIDFLAEFGLKLNDDSSSYLAVGLAYYIR